MLTSGDQQQEGKKKQNGNYISSSTMIRYEINLIRSKENHCNRFLIARKNNSAEYTTLSFFVLLSFMSYMVYVW